MQWNTVICTMIQLLLIDTIGDAYISTVHKYTTPDVDNSNVCMQIKIETQKLFTTTRYANSTDHTGRYYTQRITWHTYAAGRVVHTGPVLWPFFTSSPRQSEALIYLLAWSLPCCWRQTVAQPTRTSHLQILRHLLATPHLHASLLSALNK